MTVWANKITTLLFVQTSFGYGKSQGCMHLFPIGLFLTRFVTVPNLA